MKNQHMRDKTVHVSNWLCIDVLIKSSKYNNR